VKPVVFLGSALDDIRAFPADARRAAGYALTRVQEGERPPDGKPMPSVGAFRVIFLARLSEAVYVLHCFRKTTQRTAKRDIELARERLAALRRERRMRR